MMPWSSMGAYRFAIIGSAFPRSKHASSTCKDRYDRSTQTAARALPLPSFAVFGALALAATMIGAIATHLFVIGGSPAMPAILLLGSAAVIWARRHQLLGDQETVR